MIVSRGENVYPKDIVDALSTHKWIELVVVKPVSEIDFGKILIAYVVPKISEFLNENELLKWLETKVARFYMYAQIEFCIEIPTSSIGKIKL